MNTPLHTFVEKVKESRVTPASFAVLPDGPLPRWSEQALVAEAGALIRRHGDLT